MRESLKKRFSRITANHSVADIEYHTGISRDKLYRISNGTTKSLDFVEGLLLSDYLGISPRVLAGLDETTPRRVAPIALPTTALNPSKQPVAVAARTVSHSDVLRAVESLREELRELAEDGERLSAALEPILRGTVALQAAPPAERKTGAKNGSRSKPKDARRS